MTEQNDRPGIGKAPLMSRNAVGWDRHEPQGQTAGAMANLPTTDLRYIMDCLIRDMIGYKPTIIPGHGWTDRRNLPEHRAQDRAR